MGIISNKISRDMLQPGDHIYSWRMVFGYAHHGIYVGNGRVIHFNPECGPKPRTVSSMDKLGGVSSSDLDCFLDGGKLYRFEYSASSITFLAKPRGGACTTMPSDLPEEVVHRADYLLQNGFGVYNVFKNNCEDFAIYCKTGLLVANTDVGRSGQAATMVAAASVILSSPLRFVAGFGSLAVAGCGMYCVGRLVSDIGMRLDVSKVPVERLVADMDDMVGMVRQPEVNMTS